MTHFILVADIVSVFFNHGGKAEVHGEGSSVDLGFSSVVKKSTSNITLVRQF